MKHARPVVTIVLSLRLATGCSWIAVTPPPANVPDPGPVGCTESKVAPMADSTGAVLGFGLAVLGTVALANASQQRADPYFGDVGAQAAGATGAVALVLGLVLGAVYLSSATYGFSNTARCRELGADARAVEAK